MENEDSEIPGKIKIMKVHKEDFTWAWKEALMEIYDESDLPDKQKKMQLVKENIFPFPRMSPLKKV